MWTLLLAAALLWPGHGIGVFDGVPLDRRLEAVVVGALVPVLWWLRPIFTKRAIARAGIVVLVALKVADATLLTQQGWCAATPEGFRFSVKAHQRITHIKKLRDAGEDARSFLAALQPLSEAGKLGCVLFQMPPFLKADAALLRDFMQALPTGRFSFEFRHPSWFTDETFDLLKTNDAALCVAESEKLETPDVVTASLCYYRMRKPEYSAGERKQIAERIEEHAAAGRDVHIYFKHEDTPEGALYAEELLKQCSERTSEPA